MSPHINNIDMPSCSQIFVPSCSHNYWCSLRRDLDNFVWLFFMQTFLNANLSVAGIFLSQPWQGMLSLCRDLTQSRSSFLLRVRGPPYLGEGNFSIGAMNKTLVVPSGCLSARVLVYPPTIGICCFSSFFSSRARFSGLGWGGVGMLTFLAIAHILDATP